MSKILVDTDVLIDYSKGKSRFLAKLLVRQSKGKVDLFVNPVVITEFFTDQSLSDKKKFRKALEFIALFAVDELTKSVGLTAGQILREKKSDYLGDALIAASCLVADLKLVTRNKKHYQKIDGLKLFKT